MYLHVGNNKNIRTKDIIGIFDMDNSTVSQITRKYLGTMQKDYLLEAKVDGYNFSFSGLKTAVLRLVKSFDGQEMPVNDVCASFQECVSSTLLKKVKRAAEERGYKQVVSAGGVAANSEIRKKIFDLKEEGYDVYAPIMKYCTDNASMVASAAFFFDKTFDDIDVEVFSRV